MEVVLLTHTPNPEKIIAAAAKLCYSPADPTTVLENLNEESIASFLQMLVKLGHGSTFEHASFTFGISGVSRATTHQLVRHRMASYSMQSQRYVPMHESFSYVIPDEMVGDEEIENEFCKSMSQAYMAYDKLASKLKERYLAAGMTPRKAEKKAIEDARYVLPNAASSNIMVTMNARELLSFFTLRCCRTAQWEIRELANKMLELVTEVAPNVFSNAGPSCIRGGCSEGKLGCGKPMTKIEK